jgi:hypothetical protein
VTLLSAKHAGEVVMALPRTKRKQRTNDGLATAAAVVIFWPAAFFVGGDKQTAAELGQMKGQMVAIEQASIQKNAGSNFRVRARLALSEISLTSRRPSRSEYRNGDGS